MNDNNYANCGQVCDALVRFSLQYPSEKDCMEELVKMLDKFEGTKCGYCLSVRVDRNYGSRKINCLTCRKTSSLTAGTFFHGIRQARPWLAAIWLMEEGIAVNSHRFHYLLKIAYASALHIFGKLTTVIANEMQDGSDAAARRFLPLISRRSKDSQAGKHPSVELESIEWCDTKPEEQAEVDIESLELSEVEKLVYREISAERIFFDSLCYRTGLTAGPLSATLVMLELADLVCRLPGDSYIRMAGKPDAAYRTHGDKYDDLEECSSEKEAIQIAISFVRKNFQFVSLKYLQNYLAAYWCHLDRNKWGAGLLMQSCFAFGQLKGKELHERVSSHIVKMPCVILASDNGQARFSAC
jgi:hypothetical protein